MGYFRGICSATFFRHVENGVHNCFNGSSRWCAGKAGVGRVGRGGRLGSSGGLGGGRLGDGGLDGGAELGGGSWIGSGGWTGGGGGESSEESSDAVHAD